MYNDIIAEYARLYLRLCRIPSELSSLPRGSISRKTINGKQYAYLQRRENGKMMSRYLSFEDEQLVLTQLAQRKSMERELPEIKNRLHDLEKAAALIGNGLDRQLMLVKMSSGMDEIPSEEKERASSFANAVNAIEGIPVTEETRTDIQAWKQGELDFSSLYRRALVRYGFLKEAV